MSRLTKKDYKNWVQITGYYKKKAAQRLTEISHKLGKLEDIEEKLGCPLEVVFKALKDGIYKKDEDILFEATLRIHDNEIYLCQPYDDKLLHKVLVKDYGKTWWLKGEKENA